MMIPLINPCGTKRRKRNPIVFSSAQKDVMAAFRKYAKRQLRQRPGSGRLLREAKAGRSGLSKLYGFTKNPGYYSGAPGEKIIRGGDLISYFKLRRQGYTTAWSGEGKICMVKKRPAARRGSLSQQEGSMVYSLKRRPRRKHARRARHNPYRDTGLFGRLTGRSHSRKRRAHRRSRRIRLGAHRPVIIRAAHSWRRPKRSKLFRRATRINPRRSHRRRHSYRRNPLSLPKLPFNLQNVAMGGLKIAGGIAIGMLGMPVIVKYVQPMIDKEGKLRKYYGLIHVVLGAVAAATIKKQIVKEIALTVAGVGVYDLISQNLTMLGLPKISDTSTILGDEPGVIGMDADMEPSMIGSSYQTALGASYGRDDIAYGDDNDSLDC